jgi:DNA modification methylase
MTGRILHGDCREQLATLPDASIDAIVTDPPYELGFMGKRWDATGIAYDPVVWSECLRVLKPGGHLLAFGGTRTYHRMTVAIEDAGFEIRDSLHWLYGSGFPKSLDVSKAIDKRGGAAAPFVAFRDAIREAMEQQGITRKALQDALGNHMLSHYLTAGSQPAIPSVRDYLIIRDTLEMSDEWDALFLPPAEREVIGHAEARSFTFHPGENRSTEAVVLDVTAPSTDTAQQWNGWGTALKPAHEPIVLARKPLVGTVAANVMEYGTGALNIDGTRVSGSSWGTRPPRTANAIYNAGAGTNHTASASADGGRWPANLVLTHSPECATECVPECPVAILDGQSGTLTSGSNPTRRGGDAARSVFGTFAGQTDAQQHRGADSGGASRFFTTTTWDPEIDAPFFYVPKPSRRERNAGLDGMPERTNIYGMRPRIPEDGDKPGSVNDKFQTQPAANFHPTVKPVALMRHLVRLITPSGGTVLDPFLGSGTTAVAATLEGFDWIGCELTLDYLPIIEARVAWAEQQTPDPIQPELF